MSYYIKCSNNGTTLFLKTIEEIREGFRRKLGPEYTILNDSPGMTEDGYPIIHLTKTDVPTGQRHDLVYVLEPCDWWLDQFVVYFKSLFDSKDGVLL